MNSPRAMGSQVFELIYGIILKFIQAHKDFGHFYGSSYVAAPDGSRTPVS